MHCFKFGRVKFSIYFCYLVFVFVFINIKQIHSQNFAKQKILINGKFKKLKPPALICLYDNDIKDFVLIDSVKLGKSGAFKFEIISDETKFLFLKTDKNDVVKLIASPGDKISIEGSYDNLSATYLIKGSKDSEILKQIDSKALDTDNKVKQLGAYYAQSGNNNEMIKDSLGKIFNDIKDAYKHYLVNVIEENPGSLACLSAINQSFGKSQVFSLEKDDSLFSKLAQNLIKNYPQNKHALTFNRMVQEYLSFMMEYNAIENRVGINVKAPDIVLLDKDSNQIFLHNLKGKTVLLKFWNPSCDVCREENRKLVPLYKKYKDFGFEVFEVSIGTKKDEWIIVMNEDKTNIWTNVKIPEEGNNLPNMSSYFVWLYGVKSVPYSFLINNDGIIVNKGFKPEQLDEMLYDLIKIK